MERIKIDSFTVQQSGDVVKAPFSLLDIKQGDTFNTCELISRFTPDASLSAFSEFYLKCTDISEGATVSLNGSPIFISTGTAKDVLHNVKKYLRQGENLLTVTFNSQRAVSAPEKIGIFGGIELLAFERSAVESVKINRTFKGGEALVDISVSVVGRGDNLHAVAVLAAPSGKMYYSGLSRCKGRINIPDPELWYPNGVGNSPLYKLTVTLYQGEELADVFETRVGLCRLELSKIGEKTRLLANGRECYLIGAELDCGDATFNSADSRIPRLLEMAYAAGINALRIRGDFLPSRRFYECADRYGILVFRDFEAFSSQSGEERACRMLSVTDTLEALSPFVSFAFAISKPQDFAVADKLINDADLSTAHIEEGFLDTASQCFSKIPMPISIPSSETLAPLKDNGELNLFSPELDGLVGDKRELIEMLASISDSYLCPTDFSDMVYTSQLHAAVMLQEKITAYRTSGAASIGLFVGRLFDYSPAATDSLIDSSLRPKATLSALARASRAVVPSVSISDGKITVSVHSRKSATATLTLRLLVKDSFNKTHREKCVSFTVSPCSSAVVYEDSIDALLGEVQDKFYISYEVLDGTRVEFFATKQLISPRSFKYEDPKIQAHIEGAGRRFSLTLIPTAYAPCVFISFHGVDVVLEDNFIDLAENVPTRVRFSVLGDHFGIDELEERLTLRTVRDVGRCASCQRYKK